MDDISVGEYIRTKDGIIDKVIIEYNGKCNNSNCSEKHISCRYNYYNEKDVVKHSKQLIDLIEVGDYVNGILVTGKEGTLLYTEIKGIDGSGYHIPISQYGDNIENIVTKECFASVSYEV